MGVSVRRSYSAAGTFSLSLSRLDIEKPPGDIHRWRRTNLVVTGLWLLAFVQSPGKDYLDEQGEFIIEWKDYVQDAIDRGLTREEAVSTLTAMTERYPMDVE